MQKTILATAGVIVAAAAIAWVGGCGDRTPRTIAVTGECLTTAPKDRTAITLRVTTLNKNAAESMKMASAQIADITAYLKTLPVKMQTTTFNSYEKTEWDGKAQKSINLGIETTIAIEVSADNIETIEGILTKFAGAQNVYTENLRMFTSTETMKPILEHCLGTAVENARVRANAIAAGDGGRAGKMIAAEYGASTNNITRPTSNFLRSAKMAMVEDTAAFAAGGIVAKDTEVSVTVSAVFEIK
ncbi:SIMPL domain-containing protein [bacterium]|nr:SIMPL domain-containing protein [bacterium]